VGALAAFLASPEARYITGASVAIDGGLSLLMGQGA
jgi:glucose 1-dehydrogenase